MPYSPSEDDLPTIRDSQDSAEWVDEAPQNDSAQAAMVGKRIGAYEIVRQIGSGGMGSVYLAIRADDEFRKYVALKIVRSGFSAGGLLSRFRRERQILAALDHPNICKLLDAGSTPEGDPWFLMDYVEGSPIDVYCDSHNLAIAERIALFRQVCGAVQYVHQNLVVHRDLKPTNILVTAEGSVKLLDFGIAKILKPEFRMTPIDVTRMDELIMTPAYASPEQLSGQPMTTASDIYSLGVLLYELLTGRRPYRPGLKSVRDLHRAICEDDTEKPSTAILRNEDSHAAATVQDLSRKRRTSPEKLQRALQGELDNIVLKAMRKEPQRRYASAEQLSEDLRNYLEDRPVSAHEDSFGYRAGKFIRRYRTMVAAAAIVAVSLIAGILTTTAEARIANQQRARAERRFNELRKLATSYLFEFHDAIAKVPGTTSARELVVRRALEYLDSMAKEAIGDRPLQLELATAYQKVGDAQGRPGFANIGDRSGALESYQHALAIRNALATAGDADGRLRLDLATTHERIGDVLLVMGKSADALPSYRKAYGLLENLISAKPGDVETQREFAGTCERIAQALAQTGRVAEGLQMEQRALPLRQELAANRPHDAAAQRDLFISFIKEGDLLRASGDRTGAIGRYREALPVAEAVQRMTDDPVKAARETAAVHDKIGNLLLAMGDAGGAMENYQAALRARAPIAAADPNNAELQRDLSLSHFKIGSVLEKKGDTTGAIAEQKEALRIDTTLMARDPNNGQAQLDCASDHDNLGDLLMKSGDLAGALSHEDQARELRERVAARDEQNVDVRSDLAMTYEQLAAVNTLLAKRGGKQYLEMADNWKARAAEVLRQLQQRGVLDANGTAELKKLTIKKAGLSQR
ncbi:MAG TPA: serine/threonine-protein kinase [Bryobacteraceae bacterium]|nr:serine/threonine-protein kinase [Bryobacteraceae bacterium]